MKRLGWLDARAGLTLAAKNAGAGVGSSGVVQTSRLRRPNALDEFAQKGHSVGVRRRRVPGRQTIRPALASLAKEFENKGWRSSPRSQPTRRPYRNRSLRQEAAIDFPILKDVNNVLADQLGAADDRSFRSDPERVIRYRGASTISTTSASIGPSPNDTTWPRRSTKCSPASR